MARWRPFFYGLSELGPAAIDIFLKIYLLIYFNKILGIPASLASFAIGLSVFWDAVMDPLIGIYSDRHYEKKGDRRAIMYVALVLISVFFFALWNIKSENQWVSLFLLFALSSLLNSSISLLAVPFFALANDLETDNEKRKKWIGWRLAFFNLGSFLGIVTPAYYLTKAPDSLQAGPYLDSVYFLTAVTLILTSASVYLIYWRLPKRVVVLSVVPVRVPLKSLLGDRRFLQIVSAFFVVNCGLGLNSSLALYYYKLFLEFTEKQTQMILVGFLVTFTLSIPLWIYLTRFFQKKNLIISGALMLGLMTVVLFPHAKGLDFWTIFTLASGVGGVLVGVAVVLEIFQSDFLRDKEEQLQTSVSGQYLGFWKMAAKISRAVSIALAGPLIEASAGKPVLLAQYFGWIVGLFFLLSALVMAIPVSEKNQ